jgi:hypothetical protein
MFCVERRKAWRMLQSKAGIVNKEYLAQKAILAERPRDHGRAAGQAGAGEGVDSFAHRRFERAP